MVEYTAETCRREIIIKERIVCGCVDSIDFEKKYYIFSVCVCVSVCLSVCLSVDLVIQHAKRMRRIILPPVAIVAVPYFSTLSNKQHDFRGREGGSEHFCFCEEFSEKFSQMYMGIHAKQQLCLPDFNEI